MLHKPGETCRTSGEYLCSGTLKRPCRVIIVASRGNAMPGCTICRQDDISWRLVNELFSNSAYDQSSYKTE
jgi:hypothetical protein